ncbi:hypothetical protein [Ruminococcus sp.]
MDNYNNNGYNNDSWNNPQGNGPDPQMEQNNTTYSAQDYQQPYGSQNYSAQDYQQPYGADNNQNYQNSYGTGYNQTPSYQQPNYNNMSNDEEHVSVLYWIGVFCINIIPCVGPIVYLVMMFVWAFGSTPKKSLKNFARAQLILSAIALGIMLIVIIISAIAGANAVDNLTRYSYY